MVNSKIDPKSSFLEYLNKDITNVNFENLIFYLAFSASRKYEKSRFSVFLWRVMRLVFFLYSSALDSYLLFSNFE